MKKTNISYYLVGIAIFFIVMASNFLNMQILNTGFKTFTFWFVLSVFAFLLGWILKRITDWKSGLSLMFVILIFSASISILNVVILKKGIVVLDSNLVGSLLFVIYDILILAMVLAGFSVSEILSKEGLLKIQESLESETKIKLENVEEQARLKIERAELEAAEIVQKANQKFAELEKAEKDIRNKLNQFIIAEKELIKKYENK